MWPCKRLWLLFIVLLHLKDGRTLGVWSKGFAWTWKPSSFPDGAQIPTAMRDESKTNPGAIQSGIASQAGGSFAQYKPLFQTVQGFQSKTSCVQATSKQEVPTVELARPYVWLQKPNDLTQPGSLPVPAIQPAVSNGSSTLISSYSGSQGHGSSQQSIGQLGSARVFVVTQQGSESAMSNGSTTSDMLSSYSDPQIQSSTGNGLFQGLSTQYGVFQTKQGTSQLESPPALTVTQQAPESAIMPNGSSSFSSSYSGFQTPTANWLSVGFSSSYANFQTQHGLNQPGSVPVTAAQQASLGGIYNGSTSSSFSGSQSQGSTVYGLSQGIVSQFGRFQAQQGTSQLGSAPALTVTQQAPESAIIPNGFSSSYTAFQTPTANWVSGFSSPYAGFQTQHGVNQPGSVPVTAAQQASASGIYNSSTSSSYSGSPSQGSTVYGLSQGIASQLGQFQAQQGKKQCDSAPALTVTQQTLQDATTASGSSTSSFTSPYNDSRNPIASWPLQMLSSAHVGSQQGNQVGSLPGLTVTQQASENAVSNGSMSITSISYSDSQSQGTTGYGLSQGLSSQYSGFQVLQGINQHGSVPALTVTQQAPASRMPSGPTSGMSSSSQVGSQNPFTYWLSLGLPSPYASFQTHPVQQLGSLPRFVAMQPATVGTIFNGSSTPIFYSGSQYAGSQGQSVKQPGSVPGLTVIQQASANAMVNISSISSPYSSSKLGPVASGLSQGNASQSGRGPLNPSVLVVTQQSLSSGSTSYSDSPIQGTTGYGLIQGLSSQYSGVQTQQGKGSHSGSKNPFNYWLPLGLPSPYASFQKQHSVGQFGSMPRFTEMQPIKSIVSNGSSTSIFYGSSPGQVSTGYGLSQGLASQYGGFQPQQGVSQLSSAPALILTQQASESALSSGNTSTSYSDSPTQGSTGYGLFQGIPSQYGRFQTLQGTTLVSSGPTALDKRTFSSGSTFFNTSSPYSGSQGQPTGYGPSLWLSNLSGSLQTQQGVKQAGSASLPLNQQTSESTSGVSNADVSSGYSVSQSYSSSPGSVGSSLGIQSQHVQKLGAFNQQVPTLWPGQQYCKNLVYSASSDNSPNISGSKGSMGNIPS